MRKQLGPATRAAALSADQHMPEAVCSPTSNLLNPSSLPNPTPQLAAVLDDSNSVWVFDWPSGRLSSLLTGHAGNATCLSTSPTLPHTLAAGSSESSAHLAPNMPASLNDTCSALFVEMAPVQDRCGSGRCPSPVHPQCIPCCRCRLWQGAGVGSSHGGMHTRAEHAWRQRGASSCTGGGPGTGVLAVYGCRACCGPGQHPPCV